MQKKKKKNEPNRQMLNKQNIQTYHQLLSFNPHGSSGTKTTTGKEVTD